MDERTSIRWEQGDDGIVVLTLDAPGKPVNTMDGEFTTSLQATLDRLEAEAETVAGVILASAKHTFFAGGDLSLLRQVRPADAERFTAEMQHLRGLLRRLETYPRPVVSVIDGAALGGGLELALATHHRVVVDHARIKLGLPEVTLGLLPGAGGVTRTVRLLGIADALMQVLLKGDRLVPAKAAKIGLVDELVAGRADLLPAARAWIAANPEPAQPWDRPGYAIPGGAPDAPGMDQLLPAIPANLRKQTGGANFPAPRAIVAAAVEGAQVDLGAAFVIEGRYLTQLATGQVAKNMIQAFFFDLNAVTGGRGGLRGRRRAFARKAVVLGAGMMGAGIAYTCAKAGLEVVLKDVSLEAATRGKGYSEGLVAQAVERGRMTREEADALLARITPAEDPAAAQGADLVIEAVFEDPSVKGQVFAEIEPFLAEGALLGSNTSTLPITQLAGGVTRPADFVGLHFFSPVEKMPLLEIVRGEATSDDTVWRALDLAAQLGKTPIVVNDARGFFTSRVIGTLLNEGIAMLTEGVPAASIEQATAQAGYPAPVLVLSDELSLTLMAKIRDATRAAAQAGAGSGGAAGDPGGGGWQPHPAEAVIDAMLAAGRPGKLAGAGFYTYDGGRRGPLWPGLAETFGARLDHGLPFEDLKERLLFIEAIEAVKCLDEGVLESVPDANIGSILGIGFPAWTGGVLQYVNGYEGVAPDDTPRRGPAGFVERARELAARYGDRFDPPASLVALAAAGERYGDVPVLQPA